MRSHPLTRAGCPILAPASAKCDPNPPCCLKEWPVSDQHKRGNLKACDLEPSGLQLSPLWAHAKKNPLLRDERPENMRALASAEILGARCVRPAPLASDSLLHLRCLADPHMSGRQHTRGGHHALCRLRVRCRCVWSGWLHHRICMCKHEGRMRFGSTVALERILRCLLQCRGGLAISLAGRRLCCER